MSRDRHSIVYRSTTRLQPYARNARTHSKKEVRQIADSAGRFGFTNPVLVGDDGTIIAGHGRVMAAKLPRPRPASRAPRRKFYKMMLFSATRRRGTE